MVAKVETPYMGDKERFCRSLEWHANLVWSAEQGILVLDQSRRVVVTLRVDINGDSSGMHVAIVHKRTGTLAERTFCFADYLSSDMAHRKDQGDHYTGALHAKRLGGPLSWYIAEPKTTTPFTGAVETYIDLWR